ncbi:hypothetical protein CBR_g9048 [Chara braunii]|uniref:TraB family protein n=1 Tax=Chara braunii TaxID=69332 RepID=A0A388KNK9_CHABU|nr:hypothetical protein CBR_g9048 [Chara braunii]|eukprot:GBG71632.1 hypothetical protein CBR_g9048 [Chara braunii]
MAQQWRVVLLRHLARVGENLVDKDKPVLSLVSSRSRPPVSLSCSGGQYRQACDLDCRGDKLGAGSGSRDREEEAMNIRRMGRERGYGTSWSSMVRELSSNFGERNVILDAWKWRPRVEVHVGGRLRGTPRVALSSGRKGSASERLWEREERIRWLWTSTATRESTREDGSEAGDNARFEQGESTVTYLKNWENGAEVYLVGTAHISQKSAEEVRDLVRRVQPDYVMVELDQKRFEKLQRARAHDQSFFKDSLSLLTQGKTGILGKLIGVGLMGFYRLLAKQGLFPGEEFKAAIDEAKAVRAEIVLGDQDVEETLRRLEAGLTFSDVLSFFRTPMPDDLKQTVSKVAEEKGQSIEAMVEGLKTRKMARKLVQEMRKKAPHIAKVMIDERNEVMVSKLRGLKGKIVAVVGLAHVDGMEASWHKLNRHACDPL